ncbi:probable inactive leucine-rich repeat receptor-like protein kinase At3g03770 [Actinidia eriantha]|uniref:probable inactive leucine-rich repeat receptor-like protein kinase At3g03770 n=1 Tax=Actinidia eriantha TaxID=165200 RepID=UPI002582ED95|nr:probable inactive leucine-rich repeat receptor-like protein kinase At3g03770 [Actinidia eriantha]XP_057507142.1 probable inactive leucine-rich repeat receptor-like protein kinase At3g03770 [Actinidia eriantha]
MAKSFSQSLLLVLVIILVSIHFSDQLQSSQVQTLLRIQHLLNSPAILSSWNDDTDFCNTEPSPSLTVVCYDESITQLHIIGNKKILPLPKNFSIDSFFTTLVRIPSLKVLTLVSLGLWGPLPGKISRLSSLEILNMSSNFLFGSIPQEISSLTNLQTLILDDNMFNGKLPDWLISFSVLSVLSLRKNSLNGTLPESLGSLDNLRILALSDNQFSGEVPDLSSLISLQVLDLENNSLGSQFPRLGVKIVTLVLSKNKFSAGIPDEVSFYYQLQKLDISFNRFVAPFPSSILALPSITYLNIAGNRFTGMLFENQSCNSELEFVDLSSNLLTGKLPNCFQSNSKKAVVLYAGNCLTMGDKNQHPFSYCRNEAFAVGILPHRRKPEQASKVGLALSISGGIIGGIALVGLAFLIFRRIHLKQTRGRTLPRLIAENSSSGYNSKLLSEARYISQAMKLGALGIPAYRTFSFEELEQATDNFDTSTFLDEGSHGQMYRGHLKDGSVVAIRCTKMKRSHGTQSFMHHIELISKLRHRHLVSALGHCFECYLDDSSVSRLFLVFEYVPNGTLRSWLSERRGRRTLTWAQRISATIGVAKGIQFLHTGIVPGIFSNNLKITDVLLDQNFVAKISSYNLPFLEESLGKVGFQISSGGTKEFNNKRVKHDEKSDVYDFGVILQEIIVGRPLNSMNEVRIAKDQLQRIATADNAVRRSIVDPAIRNAYSDESLKTMIDICIRCLLNNPEDRPSIEDVLWNLQFAAQVQEAWRGDSQSSDGSPVLHFEPPRQQINLQ